MIFIPNLPIVDVAKVSTLLVIACLFTPLDHWEAAFVCVIVWFYMLLYVLNSQKCTRSTKQTHQTDTPNRQQPNNQRLTDNGNITNKQNKKNKGGRPTVDPPPS